MIMRYVYSVFLLLLLLLSLPACIIGKPGDLNQGGFVYVCSDVSDPFCVHSSCSGSENCHLPERVALGGTFGVSFDCGWNCMNQAISVAPEILSSEGDLFTAHAEGRVALFGRNRKGLVKDYTHVTIVKPSGVVISTDLDPDARPDWNSSDRLTAVETLPLHLGDQGRLRGASVDSHGRTLYGALPVTWASNNPGVADIASGQGDDQVVIAATGLGSTVVSLSIAGRTAEVLINVTPAPCADRLCSEIDLPCCPDEDGVERVCVDRDGLGPRCHRPCTWSQDCYYANRCEPDGLCAPQPCGDPEADIAGEMDHFCQVEGISQGTRGFCVGILPRQSAELRGGICVDSSGLPPGSPCEVPEDPLRLSRAYPRCELGLCVPSEPGANVGICRQLCDWEAAYDAAFLGGVPAEMELPCSAGTSCVSFSHLSDTTGLHELSYALCLPSLGADPETVLTVCSLVTGGLLDAPETGCASALDDPLAICTPMTLPFDPDASALGTLLGVCDLAQEAPSLSLWDQCSGSEGRCPPRSWCAPESSEGEIGGPSSRCTPLCDVETMDRPGGSCADLILAERPELTLDATPICLSLSHIGWYHHGGGLSLEDLHPTRLGLCQLVEVSP